MEKTLIDNVIAEIMIQDSPDGHCDGSEIITDFVMALLKGDSSAIKWVKKYVESLDGHRLEVLDDVVENNFNLKIETMHG